MYITRGRKEKGRTKAKGKGIEEAENTNEEKKC